MFKIMSIEEHAKLTRDVDYWETRALKEENSKNFYETLYKEEKSWHRFYKEEHGKRVSEYMVLREKYDELKKVVNDEHYCNRHCFTEHILPAIQRDYDSRSIQFKNDWQKRRCFIQHWKQKLKNEYDFLESLYMIADTIMISFKK